MDVCIICRLELCEEGRYCRCTGELGHVHKRCLMSWVEGLADRKCLFCGHRYSLVETREGFWRWCAHTLPFHVKCRLFFSTLIILLGLFFLRNTCKFFTHSDSFQAVSLLFIFGTLIVRILTDFLAQQLQYCVEIYYDYPRRRVISDILPVSDEK